MTRLFTCLLLLLSPGLIAQHLKANSVAEADSLLNQWIIEHRDAEAANVYHEKFTLTTSSGKIKSKSAILEEIKNHDLILTINKTENVNVVLEGNTAILTGRLHQSGTYKGKAFDNYLLVTDTWVFTNKRWTIMAGHATLTSQP